jgi:hypothetical protein
MEPASVNPQNNIVRNWLLGIGGALLVIVAITFAMHRDETLSPVVANEGTSTPPVSVANTPKTSNAGASAVVVTTSSMGEMVSVLDQSAGASVVINTMHLARKSWVAIKDTKGSILGAGLFPADSTSGSVPLLRNTTAGERYQVLIYVDDGDKAFDLHKDMIVTAADGSPVGAAFNAQ